MDGTNITWEQLSGPQKDEVLRKETQRMKNGFLTFRERKILNALIAKREEEKQNALKRT